MQPEARASRSSGAPESVLESARRAIQGAPELSAASRGKEGALSLADTLHQIWLLAQVMLIDLMLAGDNAIIVGLAAAGLPAEQRRKAILLGIGAATVLRVAFAGAALQLLEIIGLTLAGGILLLWVAWKLFREIRPHGRGRQPETESQPPKTLFQACLQIVLADVSMSLDNVLAVAGTARGNLLILVAGLVLSVALMGVASHYVARLLARFPWISWLGLALITFVALRMIYDGSIEVARHTAMAQKCQSARQINHFGLLHRCHNGRNSACCLDPPTETALHRRLQVVNKGQADFMSASDRRWNTSEG